MFEYEIVKSVIKQFDFTQAIDDLGISHQWDETKITELADHIIVHFGVFNWEIQQRINGRIIDAGKIALDDLLKLVRVINDRECKITNKE